MALNLLQTIQKNLGLTELRKVDPNIQETKPDTRNSEEQLNQAAIPAVLVALYKYTRSDEGAEKILCGDASQQWLQTMFGNNADDAVAKVANYAHISKEVARQRMELIAAEAVKVIHDKKPTVIRDVKNTVAVERPVILTYLPAALQMGNLLNDETIDDRTNKMEGPVSGFMNVFGEIFNQSARSKEDKS